MLRPMPERQELQTPSGRHAAFAPAVAWFCLRSQPKHEHIAAGHLRQIPGVDVLNPRMRFARKTRLGPVVVTESMFPNYLFARFEWEAMLNRIHYSPGVAGIVHFGDKWPTIPDETIEGLRRLVGTTGVHEISNGVGPGDEIEVAGGVFHGLTAIVSKVMPGKDRVLVLMDFLGRQSAVEVKVHSIVKRGLGR